MQLPELPKRPVGVRKSWSRWSVDRAAIGQQLREHCLFAKEEWGDPIDAVEFRDRQKRLRRAEALYANGEQISIRIRKNGDRTDVLRTLEASN